MSSKNYVQMCTCISGCDNTDLDLSQCKHVSEVTIIWWRPQLLSLTHCCNGTYTYVPVSKYCTSCTCTHVYMYMCVLTVLASVVRVVYIYTSGYRMGPTPPNTLTSSWSECMRQGVNGRSTLTPTQRILKHPCIHRC